MIFHQYILQFREMKDPSKSLIFEEDVGGGIHLDYLKNSFAQGNDEKGGYKNHKRINMCNQTRI